MIFEIFCLGRSKKLPYVCKKYHKNERHLSLVTHSVTKLSQNMCLINTHILVYWHDRCDYKLWNAPWFYCVFWVFSYIIDEHSCLKYCIFTKLSQIVYLIDVLMYTFWYDNMPNVTAGYGRFSDLIELFFGNFLIFLRYSFIKILQIVCQGRSLVMKSKPF